MRILKSHPLLKLVNSYIIDSSQPSNISYVWNFGSLLALCLGIQIITGITLAMHYNPSVLEAFNSVEHIMRDVNNGWLIRYLHSNTASAFFFLVYLHIGKGLYYGSYRSPRTLVWTLGTIIFLVMMATSFLGYVLPYGQMSLWGATVITNLMSAIPWVGQDIVEFIWGGFSVNNATLNRFFSLHFVLPFVLAALVLMHLIALHDSAGSGNPLGVSGNYDRLPFAPYFLFKDLVTIFIFFILLSLLVFFMPNLLGDSENYVMANPMQTPPAIVPEWYLLPFYAILRSIPNKLLGVIAMFSAILILLAMPFTDLGRTRGIQFRPLSKIAFYIFVGNFLILMELGAKHVESPFIEFGQISTVIYFSYFLIVVPFLSLLENSLVELASEDSSNNEFNNISLQKSSRVNGIVSAVVGGAGINAAVGTGTETGTETGTGTGTGTGIDAATATATATGTEVEAEAGTEVETDAETEVETDADADAETETEENETQYAHVLDAEGRPVYDDYDGRRILVNGLDEDYTDDGEEELTASEADTDEEVIYDLEGQRVIINGQHIIHYDEDEEEGEETNGEEELGELGEAEGEETNAPRDMGTGDLEKEEAIYKLINDCHSEVQDADGIEGGTVQTLLEKALVAQGEIVYNITEFLLKNF